MPNVERNYGVWLCERHIGNITLSEGAIRFQLNESYIQDTNHAVLGLAFEEDLEAVHRSQVRLPPWFSNLLPEGYLREWIAQEVGTHKDHELKLLLKVGHDLPGAVRIAEADIEQTEFDANRREVETDIQSSRAEEIWRFSLAGVVLKFSMLNAGERFTSPAVGAGGGDWIVKLPAQNYENVPLNEFSMMKLAELVGIEVPEVQLVHRDQLADIPENLWPVSEEIAYAVRRFDRSPSRGLIHMEDFAQVRGFYPNDKYKGSFETLAALIYRNGDVDSLREFARRLIFNYLIGNGDAHLKNWSLLYTNPQRPVLSPAYDLVATTVYSPSYDSLSFGLKFAKSRLFETVTFDNFERLERKVGAANVGLRELAEEVVHKTLSFLPAVTEGLTQSPKLQSEIPQGISDRAAAILGT